MSTTSKWICWNIELEKKGMKTCCRCMNKIKPGEEQFFNKRVFCEECFIEAITPRVKKAYYKNDQVEFMRRLMCSYSVNKQKWYNGIYQKKESP